MYPVMVRGKELAVMNEPRKRSTLLVCWRGLARYQGDMNELDNPIGNNHWLDRQNVNRRSFHLLRLMNRWPERRDDSLFHARRGRSIGRKCNDDHVLSYGTHNCRTQMHCIVASLEYRTPTTHQQQRQLIFVSLCIYVSNDNFSELSKNDNFSGLYGTE